MKASKSVEQRGKEIMYFQVAKFAYKLSHIKIGVVKISGMWSFEMSLH